ncbi:hypothetical protein J3U35_06980 [Gilliamella sp. B2717]|uniref:hypothetical protein n=1 Tax=Gilliamella sp. B2717 TaxID=2817996 RepID=UPI00226AF793|nr:hypothetical protein [Gilliamella sp. B2717]MCX8579181.1 hypothetical protein [Gilliamella sp. B2717]
MKRFLIIITACFVLNISFNQVLCAPQSDKTFILRSDNALPPIQISEQKNFFNVHFKKVKTEKTEKTRQSNEKQIVLYSNDVDNARIFIMYEAVTNEQDAMTVFLTQLKLRGNENPEIKTYKNVKYVEGFDARVNGRYIYTQQFDQANGFVAIKALMYHIDDKNSGFYQTINKISTPKLINELINFLNYNKG